MSQSDTEYFQQRALTERELARSAKNAHVAAIHDELARGYEALVLYEELRPMAGLVMPDQKRSASG